MPTLRLVKGNRIKQGAPRRGRRSSVSTERRHRFPSEEVWQVSEDSWQVVAVDCYDSRGQLYRVQEGHVINFYEVPALWTALETVYDLTNGRYLALGLDNEEPRSRDFSQKRTVADYQPAALQRRGVR